LTPAERKCLPKTDSLHFCVVSARRATSVAGVQDIMMVEFQLREAGVKPTWYVDEQSLKDYQSLGLKAVVGGKLTPARNKALKDARKLGKVCIQCSDDISAWEYRDGKMTTVRSDDACNAAHAKARRFIVSPVAAARFICAKMRAAEAPKPKLGGVYMLGSCSRTWHNDPFARQHFIIGDFFVVDVGSKVDFDEEMKLKEDYDFACSHIKKHGSVMRCQRMTLTVKHYSNVGGAVAVRNSPEEQRNIAILHSKWPGVFRNNPKRKNEVIMRWKADSSERSDGTFDDDEDGSSTSAKGSKATPSFKKAKAVVKKIMKPKTGSFSPRAKIARTGKTTSECITARCKKVAGKTVEQALALTYKGSKGNDCKYGLSDLKYDLKTGMLKLR